MTERGRRYWAIRTDRNSRESLLKELKGGRLRQGWGYDSSQDLRLIQAEITKGGSWWDRLSETQKEVLPHLRMLALDEDSIQLGDWILVPNLPEDSYFMIVEVVGDYYFEPLQSPDDGGQDYGHVLPIRLITDSGVNKYSKHVHASIRSTLRTPMRMWNLDWYGDALKDVVNAYQSGEDLEEIESGEGRLAKAWETALQYASGVLRERILSEMDVRFQAAEWEEPIRNVLEKLYPGAEVRAVGGPSENGADLVIQIPNHFEGAPWLILIQVKNYSGEIGPDVLSQLRRAYDHYSQEGKILLVAVMTTAETAAQDCTKGARKLSDELGVPVKILLRDDMTKIITDGLVTRLR